MDASAASASASAGSSTTMMPATAAAQRRPGGGASSGFRVSPSSTASGDVALPRSALDGVETALDFSSVPSVLSPEQKKQVATNPPTGLGVYGRGPGTLVLSHSKRLTVASAVCTMLFAVLTVEFLCYYRGFCYAEEATGNGDGSGE